MRLEIEKLEDYYEQISQLSPGYEFEHRGYTLRKRGNKNPDPGTIETQTHTEVGVYNRDGELVESLTLGAFDSFTEFCYKLDSIIKYDPDSMSDWLNRNEE